MRHSLQFHTSHLQPSKGWTRLMCVWHTGGNEGQAPAPHVAAHAAAQNRAASLQGTKLSSIDTVQQSVRQGSEGHKASGTDGPGRK